MEITANTMRLTALSATKTEASENLLDDILNKITERAKKGKFWLKSDQYCDYVIESLRARGFEVIQNSNEYIWIHW